MFGQLFKGARVNTTKSTSRRSSDRKRRRERRACVEWLEARAMLTIIYKPVFGTETTSQDDSEHGTQPRVFLTFWGSYWSGAGASSVAALQNAASQIVTSTFPLITNQYGADGRNMVVAGTAFDNSDPSSGNFDSGDIDDVVQNQIDNGPFPESDSNPTGDDHATIYVVITPPNVRSNSSSAAGFNSVGSDIDVSLSGIDHDDIGEVWTWTGNNSNNTVSVDQYSLTLSHEIAELMSDWDGEGFEVNQPSGSPPGSGNQIGDYEGNAYEFRMSNGVDVQPVWSRKDNYLGQTGGAWAVDDGTTQNFYLDGTNFWSGTTFNNNFLPGKYDLTIQGDQLGPNDTITVGTVASGIQAGGVQVTENGETVSFDPGQINSITINAGGGTDTITVNALPSGVTLKPFISSGKITLTGPNTANTWNITGDGSGTLNGQAFSSVYSITGGTSGDQFNFLPGGSLDGSLNGGGGADTLSYSGVSGPVTVNLQAGTADSIGGTFSAISQVVGSSSNSDTLIGPDGATWMINGFNSGSVNGESFSSFENLTGGGLADTFQFFAGGSISGNIDGGGGVNKFDYSARFAAISVNTQTHTASQIGGTFSNIGTFIGGAGSDSLTGPDGGATWTLNGANAGSTFGFSFSSFENLTGGSGADQFVFQPGGSVDGNIDGGGGANTLDYSALAGPVTVNFTTNTASNVGGNIANITNVIGSMSPNDTIVGPDAAWIINGANSGSVNGITFSSFENLTGSAAADTFSFLSGGSISGNLDGGGGGDTLDYSALAGPITVNLQTHMAPGIGGTFANIASIVGSAGSDALVGPDGGATWNLTGSNSGDVGGVSFSSFENLTGGNGDDQFVFFPGGGVSGNIDGGGGSNTLDYHNLSTPVTIGLGTNTATGIGGTFSNISGFVGGSGMNNIVGPSGGATWSIIAVNKIMVLGFTFGNFQSIMAGAGNDTFAFLTGGRLDGSIDGGGGVNNVTYAAYAGNIIVDLLIHSATGAGGGLFNIQNVTGANGNSMLVGDAAANVLSGGTGRNVIIGDGGADSITGGGQDNILIGDSTIWDANLTALQAIFAEWNRTDLSFEQRIAHLISNGSNDGRLNGSFVFDKKAILPDNAVDTILGGSPGALDWFLFTNKQDMFTPHNPRDHITGI